MVLKTYSRAWLALDWSRITLGTQQETRLVGSEALLPSENGKRIQIVLSKERLLSNQTVVSTCKKSVLVALLINQGFSFQGSYSWLSGTPTRGWNRVHALLRSSQPQFRNGSENTQIWLQEDNSIHWPESCTHFWPWSPVNPYRKSPFTNCEDRLQALKHGFRRARASRRWIVSFTRLFNVTFLSLTHL